MFSAEFLHRPTSDDLERLEFLAHESGVRVWDIRVHDISHLRGREAYIVEVRRGMRLSARPRRIKAKQQPVKAAAR